MEHSLLFTALGVGAAGWACTMILSRSATLSAADRLTIPPQYLYLMALLPPLVFLGSLPDHPPFSHGHGLGWGFLFGGFSALLAVWTIGRTAASEDIAARSAPSFLSLIPVSLSLLYLRSGVLDALNGVIMGWLSISFLAITVWMNQGKAGRRASLAISAGVGFLCTLASLAELGELRDPIRFGPGPLPIPWSVIAVAWASAMPILILIFSLPMRRAAGIPGASLLVRFTNPFLTSDEAKNTGVKFGRTLLSLIILLGVSYIFQKKTEGNPPILILASIGAGIGLLIWSLTASRNESRMTQRMNASVAALALAAGSMAAYQIEAGFGLAVCILTAWMAGSLTTVLLERGETEEQLQRNLILQLTLLFGTLFALFRLTNFRFSDDLSYHLTDHYAYFGIIVGAVTPMLLAGFTLPAEGEDLKSDPPLSRLFVALLITLFIPALVIALFGSKSVLALLIGLALSLIIEIFTHPVGGELEGSGLRQRVTTALFALAIGIAVTQWTDFAMPLADYTRSEKARVAGYILGAIIALSLIADYGGRLAARIAERRTGDSR